VPGVPESPHKTGLVCYCRAYQGHTTRSSPGVLCVRFAKDPLADDSHGPEARRPLASTDTRAGPRAARAVTAASPQGAHLATPMNASRIARCISAAVKAGIAPSLDHAGIYLLGTSTGSPRVRIVPSDATASVRLTLYLPGFFRSGTQTSTLPVSWFVVGVRR
jgi:hypothetical protein